MITKSKEDKIKTTYKQSTNNANIKEVDLSKRVVSGLFNSYFYIDSDLDMLLPGCAAKSIADRGVNSNAVNKIKHLKDHDWSLNMARIDVLREDTIDFEGKPISGIYHESYYPKTQLATDMLINIQEKVYDNRSIGFNYAKLMLAEKNSEDIDKANRYNEYIKLALNPEVAEEYGYFWIVPEIKLWEGSDVTFGANSLTPFLGTKSVDKDIISARINLKLDQLAKYQAKLVDQLANGKQSDYTMHGFEMQLLTIKQSINDLQKIEPEKSLKDTEIIQPSNEIKTTPKQSINYQFLINNI